MADLYDYAAETATDLSKSAIDTVYSWGSAQLSDSLNKAPAPEPAPKPKKPKPAALPPPPAEVVAEAATSEKLSELLSSPKFWLAVIAAAGGVFLLVRAVRR